MGKVRLCFQIICKNAKFSAINPIFMSNPISTSKQKLSILIEETSEMSGPMSGGNRIALFVKKLEKDQKPLMARFYDSSSGWMRDVPVERVHYQCALMIQVPPYDTSFASMSTVAGDVTVWVKLFVAEMDRSSSSGMALVKYESDSIPYTYKYIYAPSTSAAAANNMIHHQHNFSS